MTTKKEDVTLKEIVNNDAQRKKCCLCKFADSTEIMTFYSTLKNGQIRHSAFKKPSGNSRSFNDRDESVFYFRFQYLKNKINCFTSAFRISVKKVDHCNVIFYKYHVEDV